MNLQAIKIEQARHQIESNSGLSMPFAGAVYWTVLGILGYFLTPFNWAMAAAFSSGMIFPLGLALQKPFKSPFMKATSPLAAAGLRATLGINLLWPVHIAIMLNAIELLPLSLGIGMSLHWLVIGWTYDSRACTLHVVMRTVAVTAIWFLFPALNYTILPFVIAGIYLLTVVMLRAEVKAKIANQLVSSPVT